MYRVLIVVISALLATATAKTENVKSSKLNIVIVGAGPAGLMAAKHSIEQGHNVTVYEQGEELGGAWTYTDETDKNKYGIDIYSGMYKELRYLKFINAFSLRKRKSFICRFVPE